MKLKKYLRSQLRGTQGRLAEDLNISKSWLSKIVNERVLPSPVLTVAISHKTKGKVARKELRPDIFV